MKHFDVAHGDGDGVFRRNTNHAQTVFKGLRMDVKPPAGLCERHALAEDGDVDTASRVVALLPLQGPDAIARPISLRVVGPFQRMASTRARPHVGQEIREMTPPPTDGNSTAAIMAEGGSVRVQAALTHGDPRSMLRRARQTMRCARATRILVPTQIAKREWYASSSHGALLLRGRGVVRAVRVRKHSYGSPHVSTEAA